MRMFRSVVLSLAAFLFVTAVAFAQYDTATVLGTVFDASGAIVPGSKITLKNTATGVTAERSTNQSGGYEFTSVLPGDYLLTTVSAGFQTESTAFSVAVGARQRVDMKLQLGATETVTVTSAAAQLETDTSDNGYTVQPREVTNLPLNGREYADLAKLTPGVHTSTLENESSTSRDASYNVNGLRSSWNNFILDGLDNNSYGVDNQGFSNQAIQPVLDAVNEFRVSTDNYSAEYGRAGGAVINASTKSGGSQFHGAAWDFIRNPAANAVGPFPLTPGSVPGPHQNQFGGVFGGPLPLHVITRTGKTFFFVDYEGVRRVQRAPLSATIPTAAQLNALLSGNTPFYDSVGNVINLVNPYTTTYTASTPIPGGIITASALTPFAKIVLGNLVNVANQPGTAVASGNFTSNPSGTVNSDKGDGRFDWDISQRQSFFVRYSSRAANVVDPSPIPAPDYGKSNGNTYQANQQVASGYTFVLTPMSALDVRIGFTWSQANRKPFNLGGDNILADANIPNAPSDPTISGGLNTQSVTGFSPTWGRSASTPTTVNPFAIDPKINYSLLRGKHSLKFGYEYQHVSTVISNTHPQFGTDTYKGLFTEGSLKAKTLASTGAADPAYKQAWALADFAFGARSEYELSNNTFVTDNLRMHAAYAQDDWRALPNLTLNIGLRYEFATPVWESNNHLSNFSPATQQLTLATPGSLYNRGLVNPNWLNFAPRIGFSYSVNPKTVIRGGFGIGFVQFNRVAGADELASNLPTSIDVPVLQFAPAAKTGAQPLCTSPQTQTVGTCFVTTQQGYPNSLLATPAAPFNLLLNTPTYVPTHTPTTYVQSFQLNVQRQIANNLTLSVGYVGNTGVHELLLADLNQAAPNNAAGTLTLQSRRPFNGTSCCSDISMAFNEGHSNYNSLQVKLEKRYSEGLYVINSFTWSHAMDDASGHLEEANGDSEYVNLYNIAGDRGRSNFDQPINETLAITYDLPYGHGRRYGAGADYLMQAVAGGWQTTVINQYTSGLPVNLTYTPLSAQDVDSSLLSAYYRANVSGNPLLPSGSRVKTATYFSYLNPANVSAPTANNMPFGNAARNIVRGPNYDTLDLSVHKRFPLWSNSSALELRVESFNTLNRTNYQAPDGNVSDTTFGQILPGSSYPARELQGAFKLIF
jgi:Carboxypeptidase regulatory-like domain/TonB-dependent Receptor Plug Domain/TonB dependent receptor